MLTVIAPVGVTLPAIRFDSLAFSTHVLVGVSVQVVTP
jgi:hypothetical protein